MSRNGSGVYAAPGASFPAVTNTVIDSAKYNAVVNDIATALTQSIAADGQTTITANLPMATYKHTGVGNATALTQYATADQVVDNALTHGGASAAGTDTYAVSLTISPGAYVTKQRFQFLADVDNTGACTININSLGAKSIKLATGGDPHNGAIQANSVADIIYDGTNFILLNPCYADVFTSTVINQGANNVLDDGDLGVTVQAYDAGLTDIAALAVTDGNIIVGNGTNWVAESGATARTSLGVGDVFIETKSASNSTSIDFTTGIGSTYNRYVIHYSGVIPATNGDFLASRVSTDGGSTFIATSDYLHASGYQDSSGGSGVFTSAGTATSFKIAETVSSSAVQGVDGWIEFSMPSSTARRKGFGWKSEWHNGTNYLHATGGGQCAAAAVETGNIDAIRFLFSTGNITSGEFTLYAYTK